MSNYQLQPHYPLIIIGAGPAGLSAAAVAAEHGIDVALLDEQASPGGQIYRATESIPAERARLLGTEYQRGANLVADFRNSGVSYFPDTQVWSLDKKGHAGIKVGLTLDKTAAMITTDLVLLANGAMERPLPFPGWTLPGVMNAGAGQILFKSHGIVPKDGLVLAGSGPLMLLLAWQYMHAGVSIRAMLDLTPMRNHLRAIPFLPRALLARHYLLKGLAYKKDLKKAGISTLHNVSELRANGTEQLESISFRHKGQAQTIKTGLLLSHFGVTPNIQLSQLAGCKHILDNSQQCFRPEVNIWGNSSIENILIAGDGAGIGGARTAEHAGRLAALQAACTLGRITASERDRLAHMDRKWMTEERHIRPFLEAFFHIPGKLLAVPDDNTIVCRCEEITAGEVRRAVSEGHNDINQVKFLTRCGMGPCQGRQCAATVANIVNACTRQGMSTSSLYRARPPVTPLTLGQLASLYPEEKE